MTTLLWIVGGLVYLIVLLFGLAACIVAGRYDERSGWK